MPVKPSATGRLLKAGIAVLIAGALLLLLGAAGAFYFWNNNEKHVRALLLMFVVKNKFSSLLHIRSSIVVFSSSA